MRTGYVARSIHLGNHFKDYVTHPEEIQLNTHTWKQRMKKAIVVLSADNIGEGTPDAHGTSVAERVDVSWSSLARLENFEFNH